MNQHDVLRGFFGGHEEHLTEVKYIAPTLLVFAMMNRRVKRSVVGAIYANRAEGRVSGDKGSAAGGVGR